MAGLVAAQRTEGLTMATRIAVCVAQVALLSDEVSLEPGATSIDPAERDLALNEWDAYAVEEAIRQRDAHGGEVVAITVGAPETEAVLRRALAMGADRAIRAWSGSLAHDAWDPLVVSAALATALSAEAPDLVLCGMQTSDGGSAATGAATAARLGIPVETCVVGLEWDADARVALVRRELEGGAIEVREVRTPAVLTIQSGINEPRYATFRAIKAAEQREIAVVEAAAAVPGARVGRLSEPARERRAEMLSGSPRETAGQLAAIIRERLAP
jgi:electron transfer flavoprotein beta subunit